MTILQFTALLNLKKLLRYAVFIKSKQLKTLYGKPYVLKVSIKTKVKILKEQLLAKQYKRHNILTEQEMSEYARQKGDFLYLQGNHGEDYFQKKLKYLASQEEMDYTLRIPSITQRVLEDPTSSSLRRPKPERVDVSLNELLLFLAQKVNKDSREAAIAVVNSMFDVEFQNGNLALPTDFNFTPMDVQLYEALVNAGAQRHKSGTKALTRAFQNIHSMLSKEKDNLYVNVDFGTEELNKLKYRKFTFDEIVFYFKNYIRRAQKLDLPVDRSISRFFLYGFTEKPWSPLMNTYLSYQRYLNKKKKKKTNFSKSVRTYKPAKGHSKMPEAREHERKLNIPDTGNTFQVTEVSSTVRRRRRTTVETPIDKVANLLKREMEKIPEIRLENMDDSSYVRLAERLVTAASNYTVNPNYQHIHQGAIANVFIGYLRQKVNSTGFKIQYIFTPTFMERFLSQSFRDGYILLANSRTGYRGQFDFQPKARRPRV